MISFLRCGSYFANHIICNFFPYFSFRYVTVGDYEAAVTLLLACPPESPHFFKNALRAVTLAAAVSPAMHELAVKVTGVSKGGNEWNCRVIGNHWKLNG